jgi:hypothetical protein
VNDDDDYYSKPGDLIVPHVPRLALPGDDEAAS